MKKTIVVFLLTLTFVTFAIAEGNTPIMGLTGNTPIMGYTGCEKGLWYPDSQTCCLPSAECPAELAANGGSKPGTFIQIIDALRSLYF